MLSTNSTKSCYSRKDACDGTKYENSQNMVYHILDLVNFTSRPCFLSGAQPLQGDLFFFCARCKAVSSR